MDGVMTATTKEMTVTKAFRNLSEAEVNKILADGYGIDMKVGKGVYLYLKPENTESTKGQYVYTGSCHQNLYLCLDGAGSERRALCDTGKGVCV